MRQEQVMPDAEESIKFWSELWNNPVDHGRNAEWIMTVEKELGCVTQQGNINITKLDVFIHHLNQQNLLPEEQKGCRRKTRETQDQLLLDKAVVRNSRRRKTNLNMAWIDFQKACDMVPHSWILKTL